MKTPLEVKCVQDSDSQNLLQPYEGESKRSSIDSSNTITWGRSARSDSTNSTTISLVSTDEAKENKKSETMGSVTNDKNENILAAHGRNNSNTPSENISTEFLLHPSKYH